MWDDRGVIVRFGDFELDDERYVLTGPGGPVHVERQVFEVLHHLIRHRDRVVSKEELLDTVWGDRFVSESALTSRIKAARRAIGDDGTAQRFIKTVHGRGYHFVGEITTSGEDAAPAPASRPLPRLRTTPIGRDDDIADVAKLVADTRLVTITGAGGVGKTTVGLAVAAQLASQFSDGATFVDLTPVLPGGDVTQAVAAAAGVEGDASTGQHLLAAHLAQRPLLLILDNCEHVLDSTGKLVDQMLEHASGAHVLATSREPLGISGEHLWPLGPLGDAGPLVFVERARAAEPRIDWRSDDPVIVDLCDRLDNVPLALELAAGQLRRFDIGELARDLGSHLSLPTSRAGPETSRHSTMDATVDWSYQLLDDDEQRLLRHLSVYPASFDLEAVLGAAPVPRSQAARLLVQLVDKSLVARELWSGRYRLLEIIRLFARDRLDEAVETDDALERHRAHIVERVAARSRTDRWMSATLAGRYRADLDHVRQAFRLSLEQGNVGDAVELAVGASFLWRNTIGCTEGDALCRQLLAHDLSDDDHLWVQILRADVGMGRGDYRLMSDAAAAARSLIPHTDDLAAACIATHFDALSQLTQPDEARKRFAEPIELAHSTGNPQLTTLMGSFLAVADIGAGDYDAAHARLTELDAAASVDGYDRFILHWAGWMLALNERNATDARRWMSVQQDFLDRTGIVETWLSSFSSAMSDLLEGIDPHPMIARTLTLADREGYDAEADCVLILAFWEICADRYEQAAELLGTAVRSRFNATAHYAFYQVVLRHTLTRHLEAGALRSAMLRGARRTAGEALADYGVARTAPAAG
jgi:predicted ATPase/DNA-binding winged helix-turn-helix (wHTH) protein